jgi:hypothetical protein
MSPPPLHPQRRPEVGAEGYQQSPDQGALRERLHQQLPFLILALHNLRGGHKHASLLSDHLCGVASRHRMLKVYVLPAAGVKVNHSITLLLPHSNMPTGPCMQVAPKLLTWRQLAEAAANAWRHKVLKRAGVARYQPSFADCVDHFALHPGDEAACLRSCCRGGKLPFHCRKPTIDSMGAQCRPAWGLLSRPGHAMRVQ